MKRQVRKNTIIGLGVVAFAAALVSFTNGNDKGKMKRYQVIHQSNGEVVEYDTVIPMTSNYTVEQFLADKGIESENVQIIKVPSMEDEAIFIGAEGDLGKKIIVKEFTHEDNFEFDGQDGEEVRIKCTIDDNGQVTAQKWVNGEEVEMTEEEMEKLKVNSEDGQHMIIHMESDGNVPMEWNAKEENVKIMCTIDDNGEVKAQKWVNGEEVEMTGEELEKLKVHEGEGQQMIIRVESDENIPMEWNGKEENVKITCTIDDNGEIKAQKWVNGEEVDMTEEEMEKLKVNSGDGKHMIIRMETSGEEGTDLEDLHMEMMELSGDLDSLNQEIRIEIKKVMEQLEDGESGEQMMIIHKEIISGDDEMIDEQAIRLEMSQDFEWEGETDVHMITGDGEDFTIVLVTENYDPSQEGATMDVQRRVDDQESGLTVFPNPSSGLVTLRLNQPEKVKTEIRVMDAQGKVVFKDNLGKFSGEYSREIDLRESGAGTYLIRIDQGGKVLEEKVIIK